VKPKRSVVSVVGNNRLAVKRAVRRIFEKFGYNLTRIARPSAADTSVVSDYSEVRPIASYSPWQTNEEFSRIYKLISLNTLVDKYRCYELWLLAKQTARIPGSFLEVGVWKGGTGCLLACATRKPVLLCDTFRGVVKAGPRDTYYKGGEHSDATEEEVLNLAEKLGVLDRIKVFRGVFPEDTGSSVNESLAFCHIDVDVYESARDVFNKIWPLMVHGGVVVFDDYGFQGCEGVTSFVNEILFREHLFVHNLNGHAILIKI
jgi:O-methyltransferase